MGPHGPRATKDKTAARFKSTYGLYRHAAVAADSKICSEIGTMVLQKYRGNAVDAAVATVICNEIVNAHSAGIGGGAVFIYYHRATQQAISFNARELAPAAATPDMFVGNEIQSIEGGRAVGVPGELKGLWELHQRYGTVPWSKLLQPTIDMCTDGSLKLTEAQHKAAVQKKKYIANKPEFSFIFDENGEVLPAGSTIYRRKLAQTLKAIAEEGADAFYDGSLTDSIVQDIQDHDGIITRKDLQNYKVDISTPVTMNLDGRLTVHSMPLPGNGVVLQYLLNILSGYQFEPSNVSTTEESILTHHRFVEAMKFASAFRSELGDPDVLDMSELTAISTSADVGQKIRGKIDDVRTHDTDYYGARYDVTTIPGTSHFSIVDGDGNAVAFTCSINLYFGCKEKGRRTGIIFNSCMDDFSTPNITNYYGLPASPANFIQPGKRPLSSMTPTVVVDQNTGDVQMVIGAAGGVAISSVIAQVIMKTLWFNKTITQAVDDARLVHQLMPPELFLDEDFPKDIVDGLTEKGHVMNEIEMTVVMAVHRISDNKLEAVSDWRKGGAPDGF